MPSKYPPDPALPNSRLQAMKRLLDASRHARYFGATGQGDRRAKAGRAISWVFLTRLLPDYVKHGGIPGTPER
jgi:hypothetical protein